MWGFCKGGASEGGAETAPPGRGGARRNQAKGRACQSEKQFQDQVSARLIAQGLPGGFA